MILTNQKERSRFFRFAIVGAIGAVVDFGILNLLMLVGLPFVAAGVISFICAVLNNFLWNRFWTYPDSRSKPISHQLVQFAAINVVGLGIRTPLLAWLEKVLIPLAQNTLSTDFFLSPDVVAHNIALAIAILVVMLWNFIANRYWTYNDVSD